MSRGSCSDQQLSAVICSARGLLIVPFPFNVTYCSSRWFAIPGSFPAATIDFSLLFSDLPRKRFPQQFCLSRRQTIRDVYLRQSPVGVLRMRECFSLLHPTFLESALRVLSVFAAAVPSRKPARSRGRIFEKISRGSCSDQQFCLSRRQTIRDVFLRQSPVGVLRMRECFSLFDPIFLESALRVHRSVAKKKKKT